MMNVTLEPVDYLNHPNSSFKKDKLNLKDFDLINNNLPPNTGPPGTVSVNANNGNNNKNLSHVPCKFFRQGICQAGDSCPFSHNLEGSLGADKLPCKYFQKGNCKFGLKCALAHYLPDGTRVNSKSYGRKYYNNNGINNNGINNNNGNNNSSNGNGNNHFNYNVPPPNSQPIDISSSMRSSISLDTAGLSSQNLNTWSNGSNFTFNNPVNSNSFNQGPISLTAPSSAISNNYNTSPTGGIFSNVSNNTSPTTFYNSSPSSNFFSNNQLMSPNGNSQFINISGNFPPSSSSFGKPTFGSYLQESLQESPVIEEDKKTDVFEEDYVPASLGDIILTPQELQRRDSRSQSGTLFIRPNLNNEKINDDVFLMD